MWQLDGRKRIQAYPGITPPENKVPTCHQLIQGHGLVSKRIPHLVFRLESKRG